MSRGRAEPPSPPADAVGRERLNHVLRARFSASVVTLIAPAGYGKTTALVHALASDSAGVDAWYSCTPRDADPDALLDGLAGAVGAREASADAIADALWHRAPVHAALVIDDVHHATGPATAVLAAIVRQLPSNGHLVISGRTEPALSLARLRAAGQVVDVDSSVLRFDEAELAELGRAHDVSVDELRVLDGWPALTMLRARSARGGPAAFLYEEVLSDVPGVTRSALAALIRLGPLDTATLEAAVGAALTVDELQSLPMVIRRADGSFEAHSLWRDAGIEDGAGRAQLHRAVRHLLHVGRPESAAALLPLTALDADDWPVAAEMLTTGCRVVSALAPLETLERWSADLPRQFASEQEAKLLAATVLRRRGNDLEAAHRALADAAASARGEGRTDIEVAAISQLAHVAWWLADVVTLVGLIERVRELHASGVASLGDLLRLGEALGADIGGDERAAMEALDGIDGTDELASVAADWMRSRMLSQSGHSGAAIEFADRAAAAGIAGFHSVKLAPLTTRWLHGDIEKACELLPTVELPADAPPRERFFNDVSIGVLHAQLGQIQQAAAAIERAERLTRNLEGVAPARWVQLARVALLLACGRESDAEAAFAEAGLGPPRAIARRELRGFVGLTARLDPGWRAVWASPEFGPDIAAELAAVGALLDARAGRAAAGRPGAHRAVVALGVRGAAELATRTNDDQLARGLIDLCGRRATAAIRACGEDRHLAVAAGALLRRVPTPPLREIRVSLLGPSTIERGEGDMPPDWRRERVRSLFGFLALRRSASRETIAAAIWPDLDAAASAQNLRRTLNYLHGVLEPEREAGDAPWYVRSEGDSVRLVGEGLWVDVWELHARLDSVAASDSAGRPADVLAEIDAALTLWRGDLLGDIYDDWVAAPRDNLRARFVAATVRAGELRLGRGEIDRSLAIAARALDVEPYSEAAHRLMIATHLARGDKAMAATAYHRCVEALDELGAAPDPTTAMLARAVFA